MWKLAARQVTRYSRRLDVRNGFNAGLGGEPGWSCRSSTSAAAVFQSSNTELGLVGAWELPCANASVLQSRGLSPLVESVTALDVALHSAVHLPWLANHLWWMQWLSDSRKKLDSSSKLRSSSSSSGFQTSVGAKSFASAAAVELVEEPPSEQIDRDKAKKEKLEKLREERQRLSKLYARQRKIESEAWASAAAEYKELLLEMCRKNLAPNLPYVQSLALGWFEPFKKAIETEQAAVETLEYKEHRAGYGPYLTQLPADMLAVITMHKLMGLLMGDMKLGGCVKVISAASSIGEAVETEVGIYKLLRKQGKKKKKKKNDKTAKDMEGKKLDEATTAKEWDESPEEIIGKLQTKVKLLIKKQRLRVAKTIVCHANGDEPWNTEIRVKVGSILIELLLDSAFIQAPASQTGDDNEELRPAFKHTMRTFAGATSSATRQFGVIECDPVIFEQLHKSARFMVMPYMPMLVPPNRWRRFSHGAYLILPSSVMRIHGAQQQRDSIEKAGPSMNRIFKALDALGSVKWQINSRVLDVVEKLWESGGGLADMVLNEDVPLPPKPETDDESVIKSWRWEMAKIRRINCERHSLRCDTELKLTVARNMRNELCFYYPHNLDFRGRAYPLHPHLNHLGSDLCRGILEFGVGQKLGPAGFKWLKIQLANVFAGGVDKLSFADRVGFVDENIDEVFDSAERPLDGRRWWLKAEDPFQCLAACIDIRDAMLTGDPETFESHLPVHQDGSCNGLQHYAALGRDQVGAESVNLIAGDKPADVYSGIASRVRAAIEKDAGDDPQKNPNVENAKLLLGQIDRKLVKQTVMTSVYGVTFIGARNQILNRLKERGFEDEIAMFRASCYAAKITIAALGEMFKEARCIMTWLGDCAKMIAAEGEAVSWSTPMGLPVVQPYRKQGRKLVKTSLQVLALRQIGHQPVAASRQRSAFPPNFVHSLDGSHMMMTALACKKESLYFAGVHDSFWTHAGSINRLNHLLRKTFVELYSEPILENLLKDFKTQYPKVEFPEVPGRGNLDLAEVVKAPYFFN